VRFYVRICMMLN